MAKNQTISKQESGPSRRLRYEQAKHAVEHFIRRNGLKPGDRLPTETELRERFGWSRMTLNRALNELVWEGALTRVQGSGTYVAQPRRSARTFRIMVSARPYNFQDDYCSPLFAGIREEAAAQHGVEILYHSQSAVPETDTVSERGATGVLALSWELDDLPALLRLHQAGVPAVGLALRCRFGALPLVSADHYGGVRRATEYLLERGHRRIAFVSISIRNSDVFERLLGFQAAMTQAEQTVDPALLLLDNTEMDDDLMEYWWRSLDSPPTALLLHGTVAAPMLAVLQRNNVRIPQDLSVIVIDEMQATRHFTPPLTTLSQSPYQLGRRGLGKLVEMLCGEDDGVPETLPTELIVRDSTAAVSESPS
jgi:DNA-binding LacI/PurR family transcriptional regulator